MRDNFSTDFMYDRLVEINDKLTESLVREHDLRSRLNSMERIAHQLNIELHESRLEQIELLKIIDEQINT